MSDKNKEILASFIESVWNNGDIDAVESFLADEYTIHHDPGDPWDKQTLSVEEFKERMRKSRAPFPDQEFSIQGLVAEGELVSMTWLWKGTHKEAAFGFDATNKPIEMSGITVYSFENGQISGHWQVTDRLSVYQQLMENQNQADA
jgi:steroid delta-isomerase-like uncharacterized protein